MITELLTIKEATSRGLTHGMLVQEGHGAFGESDNSYNEIVYIGT